MEQPTRPAPTPISPSRPLRILCADDDPTIRALLAINLGADGFEIHAAEDGLAAYEEAVRLEPDVIVLDIMMPGQDGYAVLQALRDNPLTASTPVVLLSAKATDAEVWEGWQAGADYYITKPFDPTELTNFVEYLLAQGCSPAAAGA